MDGCRRVIVVLVALAAAAVAGTDAGELDRTPGTTCALATYEVGALPYSLTSQNTFSGGDDYRPTGCPGMLAGSGYGNDKVYLLRTDGDCTLQVTVDPPGFGSYDPAAYVVTDCASIAATCLDAADTGGSFVTETLEFAATAGTDYYLIVDDSYCSGGGTYPTCSTVGGISFDLTVSAVSGNCTALGPAIVDTIFLDGFESGDTLFWSTVAP